MPKLSPDATAAAAVAFAAPVTEGEALPRVGRFVRVWGRQVHVHVCGSGRPVLLLHGNGSIGEELLRPFRVRPGLTYIAPDRPGFGFSEPVPRDLSDPLSQAAWLADLMSALGIRRADVVAHSLAAGMALVFASTRPARVGHLVLLSPFCRPTAERLMAGLRLAVAPVIGGWLRRTVVPRLVRHNRKRLLRKFMAPNPVPPSLADLPVSQLSQPKAVRAMADELLAFNAGMHRAEATLRVRCPVTVIHGLKDRTALPGWHLPWLRQRATQLRCILVRDCGHAVQHVVPRMIERVVSGG